MTERCFQSFLLISLRMPFPKIALIGRPNVGKSSLFNTLTETKKAMVSSDAGTTRNRNVDFCHWRGMSFEIIDTGGLKSKAPLDEIEIKVEKQALAAIKDADMIIMVVDGNIDPLPDDRHILKLLHRKQKPFLVAVNKSDNLGQKRDAQKFLTLGVKEVYPVSAINGTGTGDMLDVVCETIARTKKYQKILREQPENLTKIAIVGKPNVGKSSLLNKLMGKDVVITSDIPHTTREPFDSLLSYQDHLLLLIDTAGIIQRSSVRTAFQKRIYERSFASLRNADITLLMLDGTESFASVEKHIVGKIIESKTSLIILVNKWDKAKTMGIDHKEVERHLVAHFPFALWAPSLFISAKTGMKTRNILEMALKINAERRKTIDSETLHAFIKEVINLKKPTKKMGTHFPFIHGFQQMKSDPPVFELLIGTKQSLADAYVRFVEKQLRKKFGFMGTPITIHVKNLRNN